MEIEDSHFAHLSFLLNHFCISEHRVFVSIFYSCIAFSIIYPSLDVTLHHSITVDLDRTVFDWGSALCSGYLTTICSKYLTALAVLVCPDFFVNQEAQCADECKRNCYRGEGGHREDWWGWWGRLGQGHLATGTDYADGLAVLISPIYTVDNDRRLVCHICNVDRNQIILPKPILMWMNEH